MHSQWQSPPPKNQQPLPQQQPLLQPPPQTTTIITGSSNKFQIQKPQQNKKIKNKKTQNLQQNPNPTDQSMTKLNQPSATRVVEDDEQRLAISPRQAKVQIGEHQSASSASDRNRLLLRDKEQRSATMEDDKQRSAVALGEKSFRSASRGSNWRASIGELCFRSESPSS